MQNLRPLIAGNGIAILLTVLVVLPIVGVVAFIATNFLDNWMMSLGTWLHPSGGVPLADLENADRISLQNAQDRFAKIGFAIRSILIAVGLSFLYFGLSTWLNQSMAGVASQGSTGKQTKIIEAIQPWIFAGPAVVLLILFLLVPGLATLNQSLQNSDGGYTLTNYAFIWDSGSLGYSKFRYAMRNSLMWLILVPSVCIALGLLIAVLADSVKWGVFAKTIIFVPMAISFVGASVIWQNIFAGGGIEAQVVGNATTPSYQIGLLKALLGQGPEYNKPLYALEFWGNFFLMWILVWVQTGFAMVIFSAALRGVQRIRLRPRLLTARRLSKCSSASSCRRFIRRSWWCGRRW